MSSTTGLLGNIARTGLLATVLLAASNAQESEKPSGTGVRPASPEELLERSEKSSVKADAIWVTISKFGADASRTVIDLNREGSCYVLKDERGSRLIYGGSGIPQTVVDRAFESLTRRSVIYGERGRTGAADRERQLVSIGMATWDGSRVYKTQSGSVESYPDEVQAIIRDLQVIAGQLPLAESMGSIQSTFLRPAEARRMMTAGKRFVEVDDPGRDAKNLTTLEMALRLPGRDIVVPTQEDWEGLLTYVVASNPNEPDSDEFFIKNSARVFRIKMDPVASRPARPASGAGEELPRAIPLER